MKDLIRRTIEESVALKEAFVLENLDPILQGAEGLAACLASGHKILIFGNGGSAADAQHLAAEFVNRFRIERPPLAAIALTTDTSILTSIGNDYHFDDIFAKQVAALGKKDDMAWGISTSGNSRNVVAGIRMAREMGMITLGMTGSGGELAEAAEMSICVPSDITARIQEVHSLVGHIFCDLVDRLLFPDKTGD